MAVAPELQKNSRLRFSEFSADDNGDQNGFDYFEINDLPVIPEQVDDIQYLVKTTDRIDLLAYRYYGDVVLWWIIALVNNMELLPNDLVEGETIRIPSPRFVLNDLHTLRQD